MGNALGTYVRCQITCAIVGTTIHVFCWWWHVSAMLMEYWIRWKNGRSRREIVIVHRCELLNGWFLRIENFIDLFFGCIMGRMMTVRWSVERRRRDRIACLIFVQMTGNRWMRVTWRIGIGRRVFIDRRLMRIEMIGFLMKWHRIVVMMRLCVVVVGRSFLLVVFFRTEWR